MRIEGHWPGECVHSARWAPALPLEQRCEARWQRDPKVRAEFSDLSAYTAFSRAEEQGRVKRLVKQAA